MNRIKLLPLILSFFLMISIAGCGVPKQTDSNLQPDYQVNSSEPSETEPVNSGEPSAIEPVNSGDPSATVPVDSGEPSVTVPVYLNSSCVIEDRVSDLLSRMTLEEKIGQMVQPEASVISSKDVSKYFIGSVLSGGDHAPGNKSIDTWKNMISSYQKSALSTRLGIPILYGVDAVHGMAKYQDAVVFPHNSGLGAANDELLMEKIGEYTAGEMLLCDVTWNFAPCIAVAEDIRWGRTYESYSSDSERVSKLSCSYIKGLQNSGVMACGKHFFGDGATAWGTGSSGYYIDQGNMLYDEKRIQKHLDPYREAIKAGVRTIMVSFSSIDGVKMHESVSWIQGWLKDEMGFSGFVVSDWNGIQQINASSYRKQITKAVNAGIDMLMEPHSWLETIQELKKAVNAGEIKEERIDDAVGRILRVKFENGLFEKSTGLGNTIDATLSEAKHYARQAVAKSLVLLKNDNGILPLKKNANLIVLGKAADDMSIQCGGWTINWQGMPKEQNWIEGTTILQGFRDIAARNGGSISTRIEDAPRADAIILVLGEKPYAEGLGDDSRMDLYNAMADDSNREVIQQAKASGLPIITILISGRPRLITEEIGDWSAFVMAWLPGSEGGGVADVLYGDIPFSGTLPFDWPKSMNYFTVGKQGAPGQDEILFHYGYGMTY